MATDIRYAHNGDVSIAYQVVGDGPRTVVMVPGFVSHLEVLFELPLNQRFLDRIASFARVVLFDRRNQGLSDRVGRPATLEDGMDDLTAVMDASETSSATLLGISEGGPQSMLFAATYPERVDALALFGTYARLAVGDGYDIGLSAEILDGFLAGVAATWGTGEGTEFFAPGMAGDPAFDRWWGRFLRSASSPRGALELLALYHEIDVRHVLPSIDVPTVVLQRHDDRVAPRRFGRYLAEHIPGARYVELEGADHLIALGDADSVLDELEELVTGAVTGSESDRVLATVLFTDIVDSTRRASDLGDRRWRDLLDEHDRIIQRGIDRHRGRKVKSLGDGVLATFDGPGRAIRCACQVREAVRPLGVDVRAGLHTGECEVMPNDDIGGIAVHIGARVGALAGPGEVLVSGTVKDLVAGSGVVFEDRGRHQLKGVPGEWPLWAVGAS
jgi:class 3 adenylate cyclase